MSRIPVTLLTGFLGSGKSTLLSQILRNPVFWDTAVIVNEFGEVGLDDFLVEHSNEQLIEMTTGCLCCTIRGDIRQTLAMLHERRAKGEIPAFSRLVVETTGLADPAPVIHTLAVDPLVTELFTLNGVITTVDVLHGDRTLDTQPECLKQVAVADRIVLTKTDLAKDPASERDTHRLLERLGNINPGAIIQDRNDPQFSLERLFDTGHYNPSDRPDEVRAWLNAEAYDPHDDGHGHHHHHHAHGYSHDHDHDHDHDFDVNRHGSDIQAYSLVIEEPVSTLSFTFALELLIANQGENLLRVKGIVHLEEQPGSPAVIHGVQHVFHEPVWLDDWPGDDRRTRLVFITRNIPKKTIETFFRIWQSAGGETPGRETLGNETVGAG